MTDLIPLLNLDSLSFVDVQSIILSYNRGLSRTCLSRLRFYFVSSWKWPTRLTDLLFSSQTSHFASSANAGSNFLSPGHTPFLTGELTNSISVHCNGSLLPVRRSSRLFQTSSSTSSVSACRYLLEKGKKEK